VINRMEEDRKAIVVLDLEAIMEAVRIMIDGDKDKALEFMKKYVEPAIEQMEHGHCKPVFEWQGQKPDIFKKLEGGK